MKYKNEWHHNIIYIRNKFKNVQILNGSVLHFAYGIIPEAGLECAARNANADNNKCKS